MMNKNEDQPGITRQECPVTDITIGNLRYVKVRKLWGMYEQDVLQVFRLDAQYPFPTWEFGRETSSLHVWTMFDSYCDQASIRIAQEPKQTGILQPWVAELGLRHQGCLLSAIRGPDNEPKEGPAKKLIRFYRASVLKAHVGDPRKAATFMIWIESEGDFWTIAEPYLQNYDHFHNHFVMHFLHAAEICGYKMYPGPQGEWWYKFYLRMCKKLHLNPEMMHQMDTRLNRSEQDFAKQQHGSLE